MHCEYSTHTHINALHVTDVVFGFSLANLHHFLTIPDPINTATLPVLFFSEHIPLLIIHQHNCIIIVLAGVYLCPYFCVVATIGHQYEIFVSLACDSLNKNTPALLDWLYNVMQRSYDGIWVIFGDDWAGEYID